MRNKIHNSLLGLQILATAFGATILLPLLTGLDPGVTLFTAGVGTLVFQLVTRLQIPIFLGPSFAFIPAIIYGVGAWGKEATMGALAVSSLVYLLLSLAAWKGGAEKIQKILPATITGPIIMLIGLLLAPVAVNMASGKTGDGSGVLYPMGQALVMASFSFLVTILLALRGRGLWRSCSIIIGLLSGHLLSLILGQVDNSKIAVASWFSLPGFTLPQFNLEAILFILPLAIAPCVEHVGDILAIGQTVGKDFTKKPGLHKTLLGDGFASALSSLLGGPPNTTYSEVTGAVSWTRAFNPKIMLWAAAWAIGLSFFSKLAAFFQTIPAPVIGGILILLFGNIAVVGLRLLAEYAKTAEGNLELPQNIIVITIILVCGLGGMEFAFQGLAFKGVGLGAVLGISFHLLLKLVPHRQN